jgi:hypothetical protein
MYLRRFFVRDRRRNGQMKITRPQVWELGVLATTFEEASMW